MAMVNSGLKSLKAEYFSVTGNKMSVQAYQIKLILAIFTHLKLWIAVARHNFKWVKMYKNGNLKV